MTLFSILALGFFLGMRHATDSDHVIAVTTIVSQQRKVGSAALTGIFWGIGHSITLLIVGAAIVIFGVVVPERLGMSLEFCVALMLILLGLLNLGGFRRSQNEAHEHSHRHGFYLRLRPVVVGIVHGLAGSAAMALLVLPMIRIPFWAIFYLLIFAAGTIAGMMLITAIIAVPITYSANRFQSINRYIGAAAGAFSMAFGLFLVHQIGFVDGLLR
jgi:high-affinity nickel-transport protein